jgi:lysophospholipase L1-like esterase
MSDDHRKAAYRAIVVLAVLCVGLAAACVVLWRKASLRLGAPTTSETPTGPELAAAGENGGAVSPAEQAMNDPATREKLVEGAVANGEGVWDTYPDPAVGRLLQPYLKQRQVTTFHVNSNSYGLRERQFDLPKPANVTRVVLLGDSYVMGHGVEEHERLGVFLERWLKEKAAPQHGPIEVLHVGVSTWNVVAECTYLRRIMTPLRPDLVIQLSVRNDVEDNAAARGFGELANFNPQHPERGDILFKTSHPALAFQTKANNWIGQGLDWESRQRYVEAAESIEAMVKELDHAGARYLLVDYYMGLLPVARHFLMRSLKPEQCAHLPDEFVKEAKYRNSESDAHFNKEGHKLVARMLYSAIQRRGLLPALKLAPWPEADAAADEWLPKGETEAAPEPDFDHAPFRRKIDSAIDFSQVDDAHGAQVHGGIYRDSLVLPYAAVILRDDGRRKVHVKGVALGRHELDGTAVDVFVEEAKVGSFTVKGKEPVDATFDVPEDVAKRKFVSVRLVSPNWAYDGLELRLHVVFQIASVALE